MRVWRPVNNWDSRLVHHLSFDVEEHFQVSAFWCQARRGQWEQLETRVERNTRRLIEILRRHNTKATFFVLGWVAKRHPSLIRDLIGEGHEVASHGYGHELVTWQTKSEFREDVRKAKMIIEDAGGKPVFGYRAPSFSITPQTYWALSILAEEGHVYDSSIYARFQRAPHGTNGEHRSLIKTEGGYIWEISPSTMNICGYQVPIGGGGYFRLFPYALSKWCLDQCERRGVATVMYFHPWEIDPQQPRMSGPLISRVRHYTNLGKTSERLNRLLTDFRFGPIRNAVSSSTMASGSNPTPHRPDQSVTPGVLKAQLD